MGKRIINGVEVSIEPWANLFRADLRGADLTEANLRGADLRGADLTEANLRGADLTEADLRGANLTEANLTEANLTEANLTEANLDSVKHDIWAILCEFPHEVAGLRQALAEGKVNGSVYTGTCACLIGTIANIRQCSYQALPITPDSDRPAERWFLGIAEGHTPDADHPIAALTLAWIDEWLALPVVRMALAPNS
jgi:hypothetical protein